MTIATERLAVTSAEHAAKTALLHLDDARLVRAMRDVLEMRGIAHTIWGAEDTVNLGLAEVIWGHDVNEIERGNLVREITHASDYRALSEPTDTHVALAAGAVQQAWQNIAFRNRMHSEGSL